MGKLIAIALFAVAAVVAWAWLRRKSAEELTENESPPTVPTEAVEATSIEPRAEVVVPETQQALDAPPQPVSLPEEASDVAPIASAEFTPTSADSHDTVSEPRVEIPADTISPPLTSEAEQAPPPIAATPTPETQQKFPTRSHVTKAAKPIRERTRPPESGGGGQMEREENEQTTQPRKRIRSGPQLRLVCFKGNDRMWQVAVELPEGHIQEPPEQHGGD
jgi:hypothetical protein